MATVKILIVESDQLLVNGWKGFLEKLDYKVHSCDKTGEVCSLVKKIQFDLIIIGESLSEQNGIEVFNCIRTQFPHLVGIFVMEEMDLDLVVKAMKSGFSRILDKSIKEPEFVQLIQETLDVAKLRDENTRLRTLLPLFKLGRKFLDASSVEQVYEELIEAVSKEIGAPIISLMIFNKDSGLLRIVASRGLKKEVVESFSVRPGEKISGKVFKDGKPVIFNKLTQKKTPFSKMLKRKELAASISFPLCNRDNVFGVLNISETQNGVEYSQADIEMLSVISSQAVMALEKLEYIATHENSLRNRVLLEQYMAPEVVDLLINNKEDITEVGGIHDITVLYADIRNFTLLVQHLDLAELRIFLNEFFDLFSDVVFSWKGTLDKFIGDAALVVFGAPMELQAPSVSAVFAARQILRNFDILRKEWSGNSSIFREVGLGVGISRGRMFLGNVGSRRRFDYTVIGADVNIAQRLASQAYSGQILITEAVKKDIEGILSVQKEPVRQLKGIEKRIHTYSLGSVQESV